MTQPTNAYLKRWRHDRHNGITRTIDATPIRLHLATLTGAGMSLRSIAAEANTSPSVTSNLLNGGQQRCRRDTAQRILAITPGIARHASKHTSEPFVPKVGSIRRIQALLALGWTHQHLHNRTGIRTGLILSQQGRWITLTTYEAIETVYTELSMTPGPSNRTRGRAASLGYAPPLAWDDIDNDEAPTITQTQPHTQAPIDEIAVQRAIEGDRTINLNKAERREIARRWANAGRPLAELQRVTGLNPHRYVRRTA